MASINERFMDFQVAQQIKWIRLQNRDVNEALKTLNSVDGKLASALRKAGIEDTPFTKARLVALRAQIVELIEAIHGKLDPMLTENMVNAAVAAGEVEAKLLTSELPTGLDVTTPNIGVLQKAATLRPFNGAVMADWVKQLKTADLNRTWRHILDGIVSGATNDELIDSLVGTKKLNYKDGVREVTRRGTEALVRTSINHATNQGRQVAWEENQDLIGSVRWVSTLDTRTTPICQHRDGRVGPVTPDPKWTPPEGAEALVPQMARPPAHPNCRSTTVAVVKSWKELGFDVDELPAGTRASMDGQVPANLTYFEWLKKQTQEVQEDVLGPTRFKMWKDDGIAPERFVNDKGRLLTLEELKAAKNKPTVKAAPAEQVTELTDERVFHGTTKPAAKKIVRSGLREGHAGAQGRGAYVTRSESVAREYGDVLIEGKLSGRFYTLESVDKLYLDPRIKQVVEDVLLEDGEGLPETLQDYLDIAAEVIGDYPEIVNEAFKDYDGIILENVDYITVFNPEKVKALKLAQKED